MTRRHRSACPASGDARRSTPAVFAAVLLLLAALPGNPRAAGAAAYAVVIGCQYAGSPLFDRPLQYSCTDADHFADCMQNLGAEVTRLSDANAADTEHFADRDAILRTVRAVAARTTPGDTLWFYFSGHGIRSTAAGRPGHEQFLIPGGVTVNSEKSYVDITNLRELVEDKQNCPSRHCYLVFDACYSGAEYLGGRATVMTRSSDGGSDAVLTMAAASADRQAWESSDPGIEGGLFTHYLCLGIAGAACREGASQVTFGALRDYVCRNVYDACTRCHFPQQDPVFSDVSAEDQTILTTRSTALLTKLGASAAAVPVHLTERGHIPSGIIVAATADSGSLGESTVDYIKSQLTDKGATLLTGPLAQDFISRVEGNHLSPAQAIELARLNGRFLVRIRVRNGLHESTVVPGATVGTMRMECAVVDAFCTEKATDPAVVTAQPDFDREKAIYRTLAIASRTTVERLLKLLPPIAADDDSR